VIEEKQIRRSRTSKMSLREFSMQGLDPEFSVRMKFDSGSNSGRKSLERSKTK
jgi:hypothetical protein